MDEADFADHCLKQTQSTNPQERVLGRLQRDMVLLVTRELTGLKIIDAVNLMAHVIASQATTIVISTAQPGYEGEALQALLQHAADIAVDELEKHFAKGLAPAPEATATQSPAN